MSEFKKDVEFLTQSYLIEEIGIDDPQCETIESLYVKKISQMVGTEIIKNFAVKTEEFNYKNFITGEDVFLNELLPLIERKSRGLVLERKVVRFSVAVHKRVEK